MGAFKLGIGRDIPLRDFSPDLPSNTPGVILDAVNALPTLSGYRPLNNLTAIGNALPNRPLGAINAYYSNDTTLLFAAYSTGSGVLWSVLNASAATWTPIAGPTVNPPVPVHFSQFGDDVLIAGNFDHVYVAANKNIVI